MSHRVLLLCAGLISLATACGGNPCEDAIEKMCERACECGECKTTQTNAAGTVGATLTWSDANDCTGGYVTACEEGAEESIDGEACDAAVDAATCDASGLHVPAECR